MRLRMYRNTRERPRSLNLTSLCSPEHTAANASAAVLNDGAHDDRRVSVASYSARQYCYSFARTGAADSQLNIAH